MASGTSSRTSFKIATLAAALALAPLAAQRPAAPRPPTRGAAPAKVEAIVPFRVGERLSYAISWSSFITAATATVSVRDKKLAYGSLAYSLVAEGRPTPVVAIFYSVYYKADCWLDAYHLLPLRASVFSQEGAERENKIVAFDQAHGRAQFEVEGMPKTRQELRIPPGTQDALSAVFVLRTSPLKRGMRMLMPVVFNGNVYQVQVSVDGTESLQTPMGRQAAWRITPVVQETGKEAAPPRGMTLWIGDDARRLPLKMQVQLPVGRFVLTLTGATP
jgi:hypothetical protein